MLGTASAMPVSDRKPSAQALQMHGRIFLVDCGEGAQQSMVRYGVSLQRIDSVFISHIHGDHVYGLDGLLATLGMGGRTAALNIYGPRNLGPMINFFLSYNGDWLPYEIVFHPITSKEPEVILEGRSFEVVSIPLRHGVDTYGYIFREKEPLMNVRREAVQEYGLSLTEIGTLKRGEDVLRADGQLLRNSELAYKPYEPRSYAYVSDTETFPEEAQWLRGVDVLYHETTYLSEHADKARARHHSTTLDAAAIAREAGVKKLIIAHYSSRNQNIGLYEAECRSVFPESYAASDGEVYEL